MQTFSTLRRPEMGGPSVGRDNLIRIALSALLIATAVSCDQRSTSTRSLATDGGDAASQSATDARGGDAKGPPCAMPAPPPLCGLLEGCHRDPLPYECDPATGRWTCPGGLYPVTYAQIDASCTISGAGGTAGASFGAAGAGGGSADAASDGS